MKVILEKQCEVLTVRIRSGASRPCARKILRKRRRCVSGKGCITWKSILPTKEPWKKVEDPINVYIQSGFEIVATMCEGNVIYKLSSFDCRFTRAKVISTDQKEAAP